VLSAKVAQLRQRLPLARRRRFASAPSAQQFGRDRHNLPDTGNRVRGRATREANGSIATNRHAHANR
jgi:hypothetical protein